MNIAIYGRSGSGKSTISHYLAQHHGYVHCYPGARCRELALELFGTDSKAVLNALSDCLRSIDSAVWIKFALRDASASPKVVFDGMRYREDFEYFRNNSFSLWRVNCPALMRHHRLTERGQKFVEDDDEHPGERQLAGAKFDVNITNEAGKEDLYRQVDAAVAQVLK